MLQPLEFAWRLLATGFCFLCFGIGGIVLGLTLFPIVAILPGTKDQRQRRMQRLVRNAFRLFLGMVQVLGVGRITVMNANRLAEGGPMLVLANHPTLLDVVVLISLLPQADCIVKESLWKNPFMSSVVRGAGYVSNSSEGVIESCHALLNKKRSLLLFPEGTRTVTGMPLEFQRGAARIALQSDAPILPVTLSCEPATLMKNTPWYRVPRRRWHISVMAHAPVSAGRLLDKSDLPESLAARRMTTALKELFERKLHDHENTCQRIA